MNFEPMKPDEATSQGLGCGLIAGKRGPVVLVCALLFVTLSACDSGVYNRGRAHVWIVGCSDKLKQVYTHALGYASEKKGFPLDQSTEKPRAQDSIKLLLESNYGKTWLPELFKCPKVLKTSVSSEGGTTDYAWANVQRKPGGEAVPLAACTHHEGVLIVLSTDGSVQVWDLIDPEVTAKLDSETGLPKGLGR